MCVCVCRGVWRMSGERGGRSMRGEPGRRSKVAQQWRVLESAFVTLEQEKPTRTTINSCMLLHLVFRN